MDAEGNQYKQSGFSQIKTLHEAFLFNNTLILRRNVPADPPCSNRLSIWRQLLLASSHTKKRQSHHPVELSSTFSSFSFTKKVCQSQPPTDFLFAPEIIFGAFFQNRLVILPNKEKARKFLTNQRAFLVGAAGFEPTASSSRTRRATNCAMPRKYRSRMGCGLVGDERIELPQVESESTALPLCKSPIFGCVSRAVRC